MGVWIIPCNSSFYDIEGAFERFDRLDWKQSRKLEVGDVVYIYVGRPTKAIMYKCRVNKTNLPELEIDCNLRWLAAADAVNNGNSAAPAAGCKTLFHGALDMSLHRA